jgi:hypothetical protein
MPLSRRAISTISAPVTACPDRRSASSSRNAARNRRRARLRCTALPTLRLAVSPSRKRSPGPVLNTCITTPGRATLRPRAAARKKSARFGRESGSARGICRPAINDVGADHQHQVSGGKALAALGTTIRQNLAAADSLHPRAKTMTALANEFGWLISALHGLYSNKSRTDGRIITTTKTDTKPHSGWSG